MNRGGVHRYGGGTVWQGDEWFLADEAGNPVGNGAVYEGLHALQDGRAAVKVGDKWGFLDRDGVMMIEPQFRSWMYFQEGVAQMRTEDGVGAIDSDGRWVIEPVFDRLSLQFVNGRAFAVQGERWGMIDTEGHWVQVLDLPLPDMINGRLARIEQVDPLILEPEFVQHPYRLVNLEGLQSEYTVEGDGTFFSDGLLAIIRDGRLGYINEGLETVIPCRFQHPGPEGIDYDDPWEYRTAFVEGVAPAMMDDLWGYIDREGNWLVEPQFQQAYHFRGKLALVVDEESVGYINRQGGYIWRVPLEETVSDDPDRHHHP